MSEGALFAIAGRNQKVDLGQTPLIVSMILLFNDLFTVFFLLVLAKHISTVKSEDKGKRPQESSPRAIAEANQQKAVADARVVRVV